MNISKEKMFASERLSLLWASVRSVNMCTCEYMVWSIYFSLFLFDAARRMFLTMKARLSCAGIESSLHLSCSSQCLCFPGQNLWFVIQLLKIETVTVTNIFNPVQYKYYFSYEVFDNIMYIIECMPRL